MWEALSGAIKDAAGDVQTLSAALREHFDRILLENDGRGNIAAEAFLSPTALARTAKVIGDIDVADIPLPKLLLGAGEQLTT
jgi:hypothetical protein